MIELRQSFIRKLAIVIASLNLALALLGLAVFIGFGLDVTGGLVVVNSGVYSVIAILILSRQPRHAVGWLLLVVGLISVLLAILNGLEESLNADNSRFGISSMAWLTYVLFLPAIMIPLTLVL